MRLSVNADSEVGRAVIGLGSLIAHKSADVEPDRVVYTVTRDRRAPFATGIDERF
jgi:hypothetical protein